MTTVSVTLIIIGIICVVLSIVFNFDKDNKESQGLSSELTKEQQDKLRKQINEIIDAQILNVTEKTESSLDKISNTKILEMNEYAENVLGEINRNHNETVFLYDMLNEKAKEIKSTVKDVNITKRQVEKIHAEVTENVNKDEEAISEIEASDSADVKDLARQRLEELVKKSDSNRDKTLTMRKTQAEELERKKVASEVDKEVFKVVDFAKEKENIILSEENQKKDFIKAEDANPFSDVITDIEEIKESAKKATSKEAKEDAELDAEADVLEGFEFEEPVGFEEVKAEATSEAAAAKTATETKATTAETTSAKTKTSKLSEAVDTTEVPEVAADEVKKVSKSRKKSETTVKKSTTRKTSTKKTSDQRKLDLLKQNISDVEFDSDASNNDRILKLSSLGFSNKDIAKYLNLGIGEVKLVVDLYKETK